VARLLAERDVALLAALALDVDEFLLEVHVAQIEVDGLAAPQSRRVDELGQGAVAQSERTVSFEACKLSVDVVGLGSLWQPARLPRRERRLGHALWAEREAKQCSHGRELARDRCRSKLRAAATEVGGVIRERANVDVVEAQSATCEPGTELTHIDAVSALRRSRQRRARQESFSSLVHPERFAPAPLKPLVHLARK